MTNDKQIERCRTFTCDHELHEDCINAMAAEIDGLAQEVHGLQHGQKERTVEPVISVGALVIYWHNTEPDELLSRVYTDPAPSYLDEKMEIWKQGLTYFWGQLDNAHRAKLMDAAWAKYGEQATQRGE